MKAHEQLRRWRTHRGISQEKAAREIDVSLRSYQIWESGERPPALLVHALRIQELGGPKVEAWAQ